MSFNVIEVAIQAYQDQKPGTSGLRKKVSVFQQPNYTENFIQATLEATSKPKFLVVGGDGRYYSDEAIEKIINVCAANGVERIVVPKEGILSTPAASALIRSLKADGGIVLTASHNPGGPDGDFGIKYNISNGGPAPESVTNKIYEISKSISSYKSLLKRPHLDLSQVHSFQVAGMKVDVVDPIDNYLELMKEVFDFGKIKELFNREKPLKILVDSMNGVVGPYAQRILVEELGAPASSLINAKPLRDFGGKHPDPNLTYASDLVDKLKSETDIEFGVAFDGDGDRNMVLGQGAFFVTPGDALAVIAAHIKHIKYFAAQGFQGFARSFPTSPAIDRVAKHHGAKCYETPTGWKYFGNLMDNSLISLCGEESFGLGSSHIREKDGLWACLAWLSIMANTGKTVKQLVEEHWKQFGRDYFARFDFENCDAKKCNLFMKDTDQLFNNKTYLNTISGSERQYLITDMGNFEYVDPVDKSVSSKQGLYIQFSNDARIIIRLSGTGSSGATVRLYISDYSKDNVMEDTQKQLAHLLELAYAMTSVQDYICKRDPTVIT